VMPTNSPASFPGFFSVSSMRRPVFVKHTSPVRVLPLFRATSGAADHRPLSLILGCVAVPEGRDSVRGGPFFGPAQRTLDRRPSLPTKFQPEGKGAGSQGACPLAEFAAAPHGALARLLHSGPFLLPVFLLRFCAILPDLRRLLSAVHEQFRCRLTRPASMRILAVFYNSVQDGVLHTLFQGRCQSQRRPQTAPRHRTQSPLEPGDTATRPLHFQR
jgi:hypothetical protein